MIAAILVPGRLYTTQGALFEVADAVLAELGAVVEHVTWTVPDGLAEAGPEPFVRAHVAAALHRLRERAPAARPVLVAKSLGSRAAPLAAARHLPAIWLTPVLTDHAVVQAIAANPAPALLIGGTRDRLWLPDVARDTGKQVLTVPQADHRLRVPGPVRRYAEVLGTVGAAMEEFLGGLR